MVLLLVDRALRTASTRQEWQTLEWVWETDRRLRSVVGPAQARADRVRTRLGYMLGEVCLVAGAGVSQAAHLPGWKDLVTACLAFAEARVPIDEREPLTRTRTTLEGKGAYTAEDLRMATEVFAAAAGRETNEWIRTVLGSKFISSPIGLAVPTSQLHHTIANLDVSERPGQSPGLACIITYNFDDLLELAFATRSRRQLVHLSIGGEYRIGDYGEYAAGDWFPTPAAGSPPVHIYHPHGFLPQYDVPQMPDIDCVFTESSYATHYGEEKTFARSLQRRMFRDTIAVFLGTSFTDDRIRQELAECHAEQPGWLHYAVMRDESGALESADAYEGASSDLLEIGVRPIWLRDHSDVPPFLRETGDRGPSAARDWRQAWSVLRGKTPPRPGRPESGPEPGSSPGLISPPG
jgi:hypothetical protein